MQQALEFSNIHIYIKGVPFFKEISPYFPVFAIFLRALNSNYCSVHKLLHCVGQLL